MKQEEIILELRGLQCTMLTVSKRVRDAAATEEWAKIYGRLYGFGEDLMEMASAVNDCILAIDDKVEPSDEMSLNEVWELLHSLDYAVGDVETMYAEWVYHNQK